MHSFKLAITFFVALTNDKFANALRPDSFRETKYLSLSLSLSSTCDLEMQVALKSNSDYRLASHTRCRQISYKYIDTDYMQISTRVPTCKLLFSAYNLFNFEKQHLVNCQTQCNIQSLYKHTLNLA